MDGIFTKMPISEEERKEEWSLLARFQEYLDEQEFGQIFPGGGLVGFWHTKTQDLERIVNFVKSLINLKVEAEIRAEISVSVGKTSFAREKKIFSLVQREDVVSSIEAILHNDEFVSPGMESVKLVSPDWPIFINYREGKNKKFVHFFLKFINLKNLSAKYDIFIREI
jgi:hypothetical protein